MNLIEVKNLKFRYSKTRPLVLDIPEFLVPKGEKVFLYGPSGCGKTTLLETLAGVIGADEGQVRIAGTDLSTLNPSERDHFRAHSMGYIFQNFNLIPYLNVLENLTLPLYFSAKKRLKVPEAVQNQKALELCAKLGIQTLIHQNVTALSIGQQQRVAAARALLGEPQLILADEPTSSLDFDHREQFIRLLFALCEQHKITLLFVSHDRTLMNLFDRAIRLPEINIVSINDSDPT